MVLVAVQEQTDHLVEVQVIHLQQVHHKETMVVTMPIQLIQVLLEAEVLVQLVLIILQLLELLVELVHMFHHL